MNVQFRRIDKTKISHFLSVLLRRAGKIISATKGKEKIRRKSAEGNVAPTSSLATPIKYIPRDQMINGISATANMMRFVWDFFSGLFQVSFRFLPACWKVSPV